MPTPLYDAMSASKLNPEKTEAALQTVSHYFGEALDMNHKHQGDKTLPDKQNRPRNLLSTDVG